MDQKILLLVTILAVSATATAHQEMKKRPSILGSLPSVLKPLGAFKRMTAAAKMKVKRTSGLKDETTCPTCMEMLDDLHTLLKSDETSDNIDALTTLVCIIKYH